MLLVRITFVLSVLSLASRASEIVISEVSSQDRLSGDLLGVCMIITSSLSTASHVFYPTTPQYVKDNEHAFVSSSEHSACSVEPGSAEDVAVILQILGRTSTPFAIKSGGHATNLHCSSTPGVQISLSRLNQLKFGSEAGTIEVGPGLTWDSLYQQLHPFNVTVIGGCIPDVGVGGLLLGGGAYATLHALDPKVQVLAGIEPFTSSLLSHGTPSAYPPDRSQIYFPSGMSFTWSNSSLDQVMARSIRKSADDLQAAALKEGQNVTHAVVYPNYALFDTPLEAMYGNNVDRLRKLKRAVDPANVMASPADLKF